MLEAWFVYFEAHSYEGASKSFCKSLYPHMHEFQVFIPKLICPLIILTVFSMNMLIKSCIFCLLLPIGIIPTAQSILLVVLTKAQWKTDLHALTLKTTQNIADQIDQYWSGQEDQWICIFPYSISPQFWSGWWRKNKTLESHLPFPVLLKTFSQLNLNLALSYFLFFFFFGAHSHCLLTSTEVNLFEPLMRNSE